MDINNKLWCEDIDYIANLDLPWDKLTNSSILVSGASGLIGSCLIDVLIKRNIDFGCNCKIYAIGRNIENAKTRFRYYWDREWFNFISLDINEPLVRSDIQKVKYILHMASNTHPVAYATDPIGTITTNLIGTNNLLKFAVDHDTERFAFLSSNEIYGENRGDAELFDERYSGYIDCNTLRAGYPESKRCGEALCQAYMKQKKVDIVIPRVTRSYGPTMLMNDTKAISQFIKKGLNKEDIVLKSEGKQYYSYTYVADAVAGIFTVLLCGKAGEAYNISDKSGDILLKDLAQIIADAAGTDVVFELPNDLEKAGYSTATKARLDGTKLKSLGWNARYTIKEGVERTLKILESDISLGKVVIR